MTEFASPSCGDRLNPMARCPCGHLWMRHDVDEFTGDGSETCCVEGCDQKGCPGRRIGPVPLEDLVAELLESDKETVRAALAEARRQGQALAATSGGDPVTADPAARTASWLGPHEMRRLDLACVPIRRAFRINPYLVGSVNTRRDYRDVDVRLILPDDHPVHTQGDIHGLNFALSEYLRMATGLPVDFSIQTQTEADGYDGTRNPLGLRWVR